MRLFRDLSHANLSSASAVTIGNFDGVHLGHQALLARCRERCQPGQQVAVVTFEPNPRTWFDAATAPPRLTGVRTRLELLRGAGVDLVWMMRFNDRLASMAAPEFVARVLVDGLAAKQVILGPDFRFGRGREGNLQTMAELGERHGFGTESVPAVMSDGERISSTRVRRALAAGRLAEAAAMLGRPYSMSGRVIRGRRLGHELGYPTANVRPPSGTSALTGIFAVRSRLAGGVWLEGVASLGSRPAVGGGELLLEVHLFDFVGDLYGLRMETEFVRKLRDEDNFDSLDALIAQMRKDEQQARAVLAEKR